MTKPWLTSGMKSTESFPQTLEGQTEQEGYLKPNKGEDEAGTDAAVEADLLRVAATVDEVVAVDAVEEM